MKRFRHCALIVLATSLNLSLVSAEQAIRPPIEAAPRESKPVIAVGDAGFRPLKAGDYDLAYDYYRIGQYMRAFRAALSRAENGDPTAQTLLGCLYLEGNAVARDGARAALWFSRAAEQGDHQAELRYGLMLYNGNYVQQDRALGEEYVKRAALGNVPEANFYYGQLRMNESSRDQSLDIGLPWFLAGAAAGDADAAYAAAQILSQGTPKVARDAKSARRLLESAAAKGHVPAQIELAQWLLNATGGPRDYNQAYILLFMNAMRGYLPAQISLARLYRDGVGTSGDLVKAAAWYQLARASRMTAPDLDDMINGMSAQQLKAAESEAKKIMKELQ